MGGLRLWGRFVTLGHPGYDALDDPRAYSERTGQKALTLVVSVEDELDHWVWFERLERKWSLGRYHNQKGRWRYRYPVIKAERPDLDAEQPGVIPDGSNIGPEEN